MNMPPDEQDTMRLEQLLLEQLLRDSAPAPLPDEGFSRRLMTRLPPRRPRTRHGVWLGLATGVGLALWQLQDNPLLQQLARDLAAGQLNMTGSLVLLVALLTAWCVSSGVLSK